MIRALVIAMFLASSAVALTGCQTIEGMGKDIQETGDFITGTPAHDAYNHSARDF